MFKNKSPALPFSRLDTTVLARAKYANSNNITAQKTRRNLINTANSYNNYLQENKLKITPESIAIFLSQQKVEQAPTTWNLTRQNLKTAFKQQPGIRDSYPMKMLIEEIFRDIKTIRVDRKVNDYLTSKQIEKLIKGSSTRLGLMIRFLFMTGCRISEMINIRLSDIKEKEVIVIRIVGKGSKQRNIYIDHDLFNSITEEFNSSYWFFETANQAQYNRCTIWRQIKRAGNNILHKEIHPHMIRHSTANYLLHEKQKSARYISELLGHSSTAVTLEMYIHEKPQEDITTLFA